MIHKMKSTCRDCGAPVRSATAARCVTCALQIRRASAEAAPRLRTRRTEWQTDNDGSRWRTVWSESDSND
jgi:hypothetical protein